MTWSDWFNLGKEEKEQVLIVNEQRGEVIRLKSELEEVMEDEV